MERKEGVDALKGNIKQLLEELEYITSIANGLNLENAAQDLMEARSHVKHAEREVNSDVED